MDSAAKTFALAAIVVVTVACGAPPDTSSGLAARRHPARRAIALGGAQRAGGADSSHSSSSPTADAESTEGDKKTFAYASTDGAAIATEVTSVLAPAAGGRNRPLRGL